MSGFVEGRVLAPGERPWHIRWEASVDEACAHEWENVTIPPWRGRQGDVVIRCALCHVPRCGHTYDEDPCMERRHHDSLHIYQSGRFEPLGGMLGEGG